MAHGPLCLRVQWWSTLLPDPLLLLDDCTRTGEHSEQICCIVSWYRPGSTASATSIPTRSIGRYAHSFGRPRLVSIVILRIVVRSLIAIVSIHVRGSFGRQKIASTAQKRLTLALKNLSVTRKRDTIISPSGYVETV
jgi:hypothetical protein